MVNDRDYLLQALKIASSRRGFCAPNPAVGAILVKDDQIIGQGAHRGPGTDHAEVAAFKACQQDPGGATLYVTLMPCCHFGRTPPCTDAIIQNQVRRVVYAHADIHLPNDRSGEMVLANANVICEHCHVPDIETFYQSYDYWHQTKQPYLIAKLALSADDKIAGPNGEPVQITGEHLSQLTHQHRLHSDAILTTVKTILCDDPQLNVRLENETIQKPLFILDSHLRLPLEARVFKTTQSITVFHAPMISKEKKDQLLAKGVRCISVPGERGLDLLTIKKILGEAGLHQVWLESGGESIAAFIQQGLVNQYLEYRSAKRIGAGGQAAFPENFNVLDYLSLVETVQCGADNHYLVYQFS